MEFKTVYEKIFATWMISFVALLLLLGVSVQIFIAGFVLWVIFGVAFTLYYIWKKPLTKERKDW